MREKWAAMESHDQVFFVQIKGGRVGDTGEFGRLMLAPFLIVPDSGGAEIILTNRPSLQMALRCPQFFMSANGTVYGTGN